jgi:hypothetical protein
VVERVGGDADELLNAGTQNRRRAIVGTRVDGDDLELEINALTRNRIEYRRERRRAVSRR